MTATFCAPPTVWAHAHPGPDLTQLATPPREVVAAGEPPNPEVIELGPPLWGRTIRDGFQEQTETAVQVSNSPGQVLKTGLHGPPQPRLPRRALDPVTGAPGHRTRARSP